MKYLKALLDIPNFNSVKSPVKISNLVLVLVLALTLVLVLVLVLTLKQSDYL